MSFLSEQWAEEVQALLSNPHVEEQMERKHWMTQVMDIYKIHLLNDLCTFAC